tara:strand:- start:4124 stop:4225 length:102 start_codon:yes stop_codon:yes gene_type:complete
MKKNKNKVIKGENAGVVYLLNLKKFDIILITIH